MSSTRHSQTDDRTSQGAVKGGGVLALGGSNGDRESSDQQPNPLSMDSGEIPSVIVVDGVNGQVTFGLDWPAKTCICSYCLRHGHAHSTVALPVTFIRPSAESLTAHRIALY